MSTARYQVVIVGGGSGGITVAARLRNLPDPPEVAIVEPSDRHYYQPLWTLVGGGVFPREESERQEADVIPRGVTWIHDAVTELEPGANQLRTAGGRTIGYDWLVVAAGIQLDWDRIEGLHETLGRNGVCSNYAYETVSSTWENIRGFRGGRAIFTQPSTAFKCGGAPQKICYLAEEHFRRSGVRDRTEVVFALPPASIFTAPYYARFLEKVAERKGIDVRYHHDLVAVRGDAREAVFEHTDTGERVALGYDMLHVTPPMSAPGFIARSALAGDGGWVDVDRHTLQHVRFPNVFSLGDCSSLPTSKTGAAIRKQAPVLVENLAAAMAGEIPRAAYDGYTSCPVVTGYGSLMLAEFDYDKNPVESFPFDQSEERYSMYALKAYVLPRLYWHGMLKGRI